jgi:hypothetical protein
MKEERKVEKVVYPQALEPQVEESLNQKGEIKKMNLLQQRHKAMIENIQKGRAIGNEEYKPEEDEELQRGLFTIKRQLPDGDPEYDYHEEGLMPIGTFDGTIINKQRQGYGQFRNASGTEVEEGYWVDDKLLGWGRVVKSDGSYQEGEFKEGVISG